SLSGGCPRPSFIWQLWQALVLNSGPRPSRAVVDAGAITQGLRKKLLPTLKSSRRSGDRLAEGMEKAFWSNFITVAAPADSASPGSARSKCTASSPQAARPIANSGTQRRQNNARPHDQKKEAILAG